MGKGEKKNKFGHPRVQISTFFNSVTITAENKPHHELIGDV